MLQVVFSVLCFADRLSFNERNIHPLILYQFVPDQLKKLFGCECSPFPFGIANGCQPRMEVM